jgi:hypothetical protein
VKLATPTRPVHLEAVLDDNHLDPAAVVVHAVDHPV